MNNKFLNECINEYVKSLQQQLKAEQDKNIWHLNALKGVLAGLKDGVSANTLASDIERYFKDLEGNGMNAPTREEQLASKLKFARDRADKLQQQLAEMEFDLLQRFKDREFVRKDEIKQIDSGFF